MDASLYPQLKAAILADTDPAVIAALGGGAVGRNDTELARLYNLPTAFIVWRPETPVAEIFSAITWSSLTPVDTPDGTMLWMNRNLQCQSKQINLQTMLVGRDSLTTGKANIRAGLQDALTSLPAGVGGASLDAGWLGAGKVRLTIQRSITKAERIFATGTGTQATPGDLGAFEGIVTIGDIGAAMNLP